MTRERAMLALPPRAIIRQWERRGLVSEKARAAISALTRYDRRTVILETALPVAPAPKLRRRGRPLIYPDPTAAYLGAEARLVAEGHLPADARVAEVLGVHIRTIEYWRATGLIPGRRSRKPPIRRHQGKRS